MSSVLAHAELHATRSQLRDVYESIRAYQHPIARPPIIDACFEDRVDDVQHVEAVPGLRGLRESVRKDLDILDKFLENPRSASAPALSTNAPYLVSVWKEVLAAGPVVAVGKTFNVATAGGGRKSRKLPAATVKVDVVTGGGKEWIRVNTMKNSRMLAELREIDSYDTDSSEDGEDAGRPSLAQAELDNSLLRAGRALVAAASANPLGATADVPRVTLRLTRLDPAPASVRDSDPRIEQTIQYLQDMGLRVLLGELPEIGMLVPAGAPSPPPVFRPTQHVNLDLSILVALVSDLTHAPLPASIDEANARFTPPASYLAWKQARIAAGKAPAPKSASASARGLESHARALAAQAQQEARHGLFAELCARAPPGAEFWTTPEAVARCARIVGKIGGAREKRRAAALFDATREPGAAADEFWAGSRWLRQCVPLVPLRILPALSAADGVVDGVQSEGGPVPAFFDLLRRTCLALLADDPIPHPQLSSALTLSVQEPSPASSSVVDDTASDEESDSEIQRAPVISGNVKLTAHTVESMLHGATRGWTTLTANKASVRAVLKETRARSAGMVFGEGASAEHPVAQSAALWIVEPRSLAEGMRSDYVE